MNLGPDCLLIELHPGPFEQRLAPQWTGPLVLATSDGTHEPQLGDEGWKVNINDLHALLQTVRHALGQQMFEPQKQHPQRDLRRLQLHVLVAEDNVINQLILRDQLEELGCTVELASNGEEALSLWHSTAFDIVLTDVNMPRLNGYQLAEALRRLGCTTPIIGATANAMRGEEALCLAAGMNHCLVKPFTLRALFNCLAPYERVTHEAL